MVYAAVKLYEELKESGEFDDVEVALITGHHDVGVKSDLELTRQLDMVLEKFPAEGVIPVTDGAEDEQIFPIITSRLPIVSSRRIVVKQSEGIETTYYIIYRYIKEILSDPEAAKVFLGIPGLVLLLYGIARLISIKYPQSVNIISATVTGTILFLVGTYFFTRGFRIRFSIRETVTKQFIPLIAFVAGLLIMIAGAINVYLNLETIAERVLGFLPGTDLLQVLLYMNVINTPFVIGIGVMILGKVVQAYMKRDHHLWYYVSGILILPAFWVTIDLTTRYAMSIIALSEFEVFKKALIGIADLIMSVLIGMYLKEKVKGWEKVEAGTGIERV